MAETDDDMLWNDSKDGNVGSDIQARHPCCVDIIKL